MFSESHQSSLHFPHRLIVITCEFLIAIQENGVVFLYTHMIFEKRKQYLSPDDTELYPGDAANFWHVKSNKIWYSFNSTFVTVLPCVYFVSRHEQNLHACLVAS